MNQVTKEVEKILDGYLLATYGPGHDFYTHPGAGYCYLSDSESAKGAISYPLSAAELLRKFPETLFLDDEGRIWLRVGMDPARIIGQIPIDWQKLSRQTRDALNKASQGKILEVAYVLGVLP